MLGRARNRRTAANPLAAAIPAHVEALAARGADQRDGQPEGSARCVNRCAGPPRRPPRTTGSDGRYGRAAATRVTCGPLRSPVGGWRSGRGRRRRWRGQRAEPVEGLAQEVEVVRGGAVEPPAASHDVDQVVQVDGLTWAGLVLGEEHREIDEVVVGDRVDLHLGQHQVVPVAALGSQVRFADTRGLRVRRPLAEPLLRAARDAPQHGRGGRPAGAGRRPGCRWPTWTRRSAWPGPSRRGCYPAAVRDGAQHPG